MASMNYFLYKYNIRNGCMCLVLYGRYKTVKEQLNMINNVTFDFETIAN